MGENLDGQFTDTEEAYLKIFFPTIREQLPKIDELPQKIEIPEPITLYVNELVQRTLEEAREYDRLVYLSNYKIQTKEVKRGKSGSIFPVGMYKRAFLNKPALVYIHTHSEDSAPSVDDLELFETLQQGAYAYIIASDENISMLLQTQESMKFPISSKLNGMITAFRAEKVLMETAREVHNQVEGKKRFSRRHAMDGERKRLICQLYGQKIAQVCEQAGFGYYRFEGNTLNEGGILLLNKVGIE